jgi:NADPH2:quinone reductase
MKALAYYRAHSLADFAVQEMELPEPTLQAKDVLIRVQAVSVNPVDFKIRTSRSAEGDRPVILGWDAAGIIEKIGPEVEGFQPGDEVYYSGELMRDGSNAEYQAVDHRIIARKPKNLSWAGAAALPLTSVTAWEALLERGIDYVPDTHVLIIGGAGGVGSIAIQLLKALTPARVLATASRPETVEWCRSLGADSILNHANDLAAELKKQGLVTVDVVFGTTHSDRYLATIPDLLRSWGHFSLIDDPKSLDIVTFKRKAINVHWEFMFSKTLFNYHPESQGKILADLTQLVEAGKVKSTVGLVLPGLTVENLKKAHTKLEASESIGKIVLDFAGK